jgi:hypothetical protein
MAQVTMVQTRRRGSLTASAMALGLVGVMTAHAEAIRGWVADEGCARGRASGGTYTGTNPDCARKCILDGAKTVLIDSEHKRILVVGNPAAVKENIGDYIEVQGTLESGSKALYVDSLKLIEKGVAKCDLKAH